MSNDVKILRVSRLETARRENSIAGGNAFTAALVYAETRWRANGSAKGRATGPHARLYGWIASLAHGVSSADAVSKTTRRGLIEHPYCNLELPLWQKKKSLT